MVERMVSFFKTVVGNKSESITLDKFDYLLGVLETATDKAHHDENVRKNIIQIADKLEYSVSNGNGEIVNGMRRDKVLKALNGVKIHTLTSGDFEDYQLFLRLDKTTQKLETM